MVPVGPCPHDSAWEAMMLNGENKKRFGELLEGNRRFFEEEQTHPGRSSTRRTEEAAAQHPTAVIISCSDSRVPPEILFDQGLGDLFVIRTAGNVIDDTVLGSIEYAVAHLGVRLVVVLGHTNCGAIGAAVAGGESKGHLGSVIEALSAAVDAVRHIEGDTYDLASRRNVELTVDALKSSEPVLAPLMGELDIVGCYYDLDSGKIRIIC
jgi:carbonic anhydrase